MNQKPCRFVRQSENSAPIFRVLAVASVLLLAPPAWAQTLVKISTDNFTNSDSQHKSEVEPDTASWGNTIVSTFQVARRPFFGGADVGFAASTDAGVTWRYGYLPGLTVNYQNGHYYAASDPSVAYDAKHNVWLISTLALVNPIGDVAVSRSTDGGLHWGNPIVIDGTQARDSLDARPRMRTDCSCSVACRRANITSLQCPPPMCLWMVRRPGRIRNSWNRLRVDPHSRR